MVTKTILNAPDYHESARLVPHLLLSVLYSSSAELWDQLLLHRSRVEDQLASLGLLLVIDEHDGFAYVRQIESGDDFPPGYEKIPRLLRRKRLGYNATLLAVILRDELRKLDETSLDGTRPVVESGQLLEIWQGMVHAEADEKKLQREFSKCLTQMTDLGFLSRIEKDGTEYEIRSILRARISLAFLKNLQEKLTPQTPADTDE